jgi:YihY family inner membrane protein
MDGIKRLIRAVDEYQHARPWLALPVALARTYADNQGWYLAALIAYYAFIAIFPLLLVLVTVLNWVLQSDSAIKHSLIGSALTHYPVIGPQLQHNIEPLKATGVAMVAGLLGSLFGARGVARAMQVALNVLWEVPRARWPKFPWSWLRGFAALAVIGLCLVTTSVLSSLASGAGQVLTGFGSAILALAVSLGLNMVMFWVSFRLDAAAEIGWRQLLPGAMISAVSWQVMQGVGGYLITHQVARSSNLYGTFAIVLGLLAWLYIQSQLTLVSIEANVVIARRMWPRKILERNDHFD